jgi:micrococcal nuclease
MLYGFAFQSINGFATTSSENVLVDTSAVSPLPAVPLQELLSEITDETQLFGPYKVIRVVDGDTIIVLIDEEKVKVRLIGVDTPESVHPDTDKNTEYGEIASAFTKELLDGKNVFLEYDIDATDKYGRTLAYVYLEETKIMVNRLLLQNGHALIMTIQPNSKYADEFFELQKQARKVGIGLWA